MNSKLKKLGLSDTKNQIKCHTPTRSSIKTQKDASSSRTGQQQKGLNPSLSGFKLFPKGVDRQELVLNILIGVIKKKQKQQCTIVGHDRNAIKYICLSETCGKRTGCSYCFLEEHKNHSNIQAKLCLNDLVQLQQKVQLNRQILITQTLIKKEQILMKIQREVNNIRSQFLNGLEYLNNKIKQAIQSKFKETITNLTYTHTHNSKSTTFDRSAKNKVEEYNTNAQQMCQDDNIISKFMLSDFKTQVKSTPKPKLQNYKQDHIQYLLKKEDEHHILNKLSRLNITYFQQYLKQEIIQVKSFLSSFKIYEQYYAQLSSSILQMFATFKRAVPSIKSYTVGLIQPQILKPFTMLK